VTKYNISKKLEIKKAAYAAFFVELNIS